MKILIYMKSLLTDISWRLASVRVRYTVGELLSWCLVCLVQQLLPSSAGVIITPSSWVHCHSPGETLCLSGRHFDSAGQCIIPEDYYAVYYYCYYYFATRSQ